MSNEQGKLEKIGAIWVNQSKAGNQYMSITLEINGETVKAIGFKNKYKTSDRHPGWNIFKDEKENVPQAAFPDDDIEDTPTATPAPAESTSAISADGDGFEDDDIPF